MIIQATPYGTKKEEPFAFTYSGDFTDERVDGIGDVTLNTSGTLVTTGQTVKVQVYILAGGGGGAYNDIYSNQAYYGTGGGGGYQTVEIELTPGTYEITIGTGGAGKKAAANSVKASNGGDTVAFGYTSTGGGGGNASTVGSGGTGGTPNGGAGTYIKGGAQNQTIKGGNPNGGSATNNASKNKGGDGLVRITFS